MALDPFTWAAIGSSILGAGSSLYSANSAADAQKKGNKQAIAEQRRQYDNAMSMLEPSRYLGYQAMGDLANLYGYGMSGYTPYNSATGGSGVYSVKGNVGGGGGGGGSAGMAGYGGMVGATLNSSLGGALGSFAGPIGMVAGGLLGGALGGSDKKPVVGGTINANTGYVDAQGGTAGRDDAFTNYLRTGTGLEGLSKKDQKKYANLISSINQLRASGWTWDAANNRGNVPGSVAPTQPGQPGNMSRFFTSPDYTFRRDEGQRDIGNSFAARGGAASGNALRALTQFNSNLASGEYGNYVGRLMQMAGMGNASTNTAVQQGQVTANNVAQQYQNIGDSRASGIYGAANGATNAINTGLQNWMMYRYLSPQGG